MERDALLNHSSSYLQQERMCLSADAYQAVLCEECGILTCNCVGCKNVDISKITIPYPMKLLNDYVTAANMKLKIKTKQI